MSGAGRAGLGVRLLGAAALVLAAACSADLRVDVQLRPAAEAAWPDGVAASADEIELGRMLFWDPVLSGDRDVACASCHHPDQGYSDGKPRSVGTGGAARGADGASQEAAAGRLLNAQSILDVGWNGVTASATPDPREAPMFWDVRVRSLETQALQPLLSAAEMRGSRFTEAEIVDEILSRLAASAEYGALFEAAFGDREPTLARVTGAIASFERTLVTGESAFDRWVRGDDDALDAQQLRGLVSFFDSGCAGCHSGAMFSDFSLHRLGLGEGDERRRAFRTPSLRNLRWTGPYMHDGSVGSLTEAVRLYTNVDRSLDPKLADLQPVTGQTGADIARFLEALSDGAFDRTVPGGVPSGLPPGPPTAR